MEHIEFGMLKDHDSHVRLLQFCGMGAFFVIIIIVVWAFCLNASFMQSVVNFDWPALSTIPQAFVDALFVCSSLYANLSGPCAVFGDWYRWNV